MGRHLRDLKVLIEMLISSSKDSKAHTSPLSCWWKCALRSERLFDHLTTVTRNIMSRQAHCFFSAAMLKELICCGRRSFARVYRMQFRNCANRGVGKGEVQFLGFKCFGQVSMCNKFLKHLGRFLILVLGFVLFGYFMCVSFYSYSRFEHLQSLSSTWPCEIELWNQSNTFQHCTLSESCP